MTKSQFKPPISITFPPTIIGFPDRLITILKYSESYTFNGSAAPAAQQWTVNSAFDPNNTGVGHQPSFYDTFSAIYARYFVRAFKVDISVNNHATTAGAYVVAGYSDVQIAANTVEQLIEAKYAKYVLLGESTGAGNVRTISLPWMSSQKLMGQPFTEADDNMYAAFNASPTDTAWSYLKVAADDGTTTVGVLARVVIHMEICFKDLLPQVSS